MSTCSGFTAINADPNSTFRPRFRRLRSASPSDDSDPYLYLGQGVGEELDQLRDQDYEEVDDYGDNIPSLSQMSDDALDARHEDAFLLPEEDDRSTPVDRELDDTMAQTVEPIGTTINLRHSDGDVIEIYAAGHLLEPEGRPTADPRTDKLAHREIISLLSSPEIGPRASPMLPRRSADQHDFEDLCLNDEDFHDVLETIDDASSLGSPGRPEGSHSMFESTATLLLPPPASPPSKYFRTPERPGTVGRKSGETPALPTPPDSAGRDGATEEEMDDRPTLLSWRRTSFADRIPLYPVIPGFSRNHMLRVFPRLADAISKGKTLTRTDPDTTVVVYGRLLTAVRCDDEQHFRIEDIVDDTAGHIDIIWSGWAGRPLLRTAADALLQVSAGGARKFVEAMGRYERRDERWIFRAKTVWEVGLQDMRNVAHIYDLK